MVHEPGIPAGVAARLDQGRGAHGDRLYSVRSEGRRAAWVATRMEPDERAKSERHEAGAQAHSAAEIAAGRSTSHSGAISGFEEVDMKPMRGRLNRRLAASPPFRGLRRSLTRPPKTEEPPRANHLAFAAWLHFSDEVAWQ